MANSRFHYTLLVIQADDESGVVLAHRYCTRQFLSFDEHAFRQVRPLQGRSFVELPADA